MTTRLTALTSYYEVIKFAEARHDLDLRGVATSVKDVHRAVRAVLRERPRLVQDPHLSTAFLIGPWAIELEQGRDVALNAARIARELERPVSR